MARRSHRFVEEYEGLVGLGLDRETDEYTVTCYLQMFSDDRLMELLRRRMSDEDLAAVFDLVGDLLRKYLSEGEYHEYFLKDEEKAP